MPRTRPRSSPAAAWLTSGALLGGVGCGFRASPSGLVPDDARVDGPGAPDAAEIDGAPGVACYGPPGPWQVCLAAAPTEAIGLPPTLDTDRSSQCLAAQPAGWSPAQPPACFIVGDTVTVPTTLVTGRRPLVLVAQTQITIGVLLDVASHHNNGGPAASPPGVCGPFGQNPAGGGGGGGGAGGSFMTKAGNGGRGDGAQAQNGQADQADSTVPAQLRGGCAGQPGGGGGANDAGDGGGAVYLVSRNQIVATGVINASGGGGSGGNQRTGGSGGGSGGMIVLYGAAITATTLVAHGGGGASGGGQTAKGADGADPLVTLPLVAASGGSNTVAGTGGDGFPATDNALDGNGGPNNAGGGGGGGGAGYIRANQSLGIAIVSPAADIVP